MIYIFPAYNFIVLTNYYYLYIHLLIILVYTYRRTVVKNSINKGRKFYGCGGNERDRCDFFQWSDVTETARPNFRGIPTENAGQNFGGTRDIRG